jgi:hypothetical protein
MWEAGMDMELKIFFGALAIVWLGSAVIVARISTLQTHLKYVDALIVFPVAALLLPASIYVAEQLAPETLVLLRSFSKTLLAPLTPGLRHACAVAVILAAIWSVPTWTFYYWRKFLHAREERILAARAAMKSH